jgi:hypothetical protein
VALPTGLELVTAVFRAMGSLAKSLNLLKRILKNQHEHIRNISAFSGNIPEAIFTASSFNTSSRVRSIVFYFGG